MLYILIILSFLLETSFTNILSVNSYFIPQFLITSLVILYPYFKNNKLNFFLICIVFGYIYDVSFINSTYINTISFGVCSLAIMILNKYFNLNIYSLSIINILIIALFRIISYLLLLMPYYSKFNLSVLIESIYSSILINLIYGVFLYLISSKTIKN